MSKWEMVRLSDVADISAGQGAPQGKGNYCDDGIPFVKAGNLEFLVDGGCLTDIQKVNDSVAEDYRLKLYTQGTVVFAKSGMSCMKGYVYSLADDCYVVNHLACITPRVKLNSGFLKYYLTYRKPNNLVKDTAYPSITLSDIAGMHIPHPPLETQRKIAKSLDTVSEILAMRKQQLAELDNLIKSTFYDMFGDPVTNEKGWKLSKVKDVCSKILGGGTPPKKHSEYYTGNIPWVTPKDMKTDTIVDSRDHITHGALDNCPAKLVPPQSVLMVIRSGILKKTLPVAINLTHVTVNQDMKAFLPNERIIAEYLLYSFKLMESSILKNVRAVTADNLEFGLIRDLCVPAPPLTLQRAFAGILAKLEENRVNIQRATKETQHLYDSLMSRYFD